MAMEIEHRCMRCGVPWTGSVSVNPWDLVCPSCGQRAGIIGGKFAIQTTTDETFDHKREGKEDHERVRGLS